MKTTITKFLIRLSVLIFYGGTLQAQNPSKILTPFYLNYTIFGEEYESLPTPSTAVPLPGFDPTHGYNGFKAKGSQNIQVDAEGKIMFFIVDGYIFDRKGNLFGLVALNAATSSSNTGLGDGGFTETSIIPSPDCGESNAFFILTTYKLATGTEGYLACWDKIVISYDSNDNPIPDSYVLSKKINLGQSSMPLGDLLLENLASGFGDMGVFGHCNAPYMATSRVLSGNKRFVYVLNRAKIYRFKIQSNQFTYDNYSVDLNPLFHDIIQCSQDDRSEMELVTLPNGNLRLAFRVQANPIINPTAIRPGFATLDFNSSSGNVIPGSLKNIYYPIGSSYNENSLDIKGAELSPDGSKLYLSHNLQIAYPSTLDI